MGGRREHNQYEPLLFIKRNNEKGNNVAFCLICEKDIGNTAIKRLESHRRVCKVKKNKEVSTDNNLKLIDCELETEKNNNILKRKAIDSVELDSNSSLTRMSDQEILSENHVNNLEGKINENNDKIKNSNRPVMPKKIVHKTMVTYIDKVDSSEANQITKAIVKFLIVNQLPFYTIRSRYAQDVLHFLRPGYKIPTVEELQNNLDILHRDIAVPKDINTTGILLINLQKNDVICLTFNKKKNFVFIQYKKNILDSEVKEFINTCILKANTLKSETRAIVSNIIINNEIQNSFSSKKLKFFECALSRINNFFHDYFNLEFFKMIDTLSKSFQCKHIEKKLIEQGGSPMPQTNKVSRNIVNICNKYM